MRREENDCVSCERCVNCGARNHIYWYCDECEDSFEELYIYEGEELCWDCYKAKFTSKVCDDCDDTLCANCGAEDEELFLYDGEWVCEECLENMAERVDMEE